MKKKAMFISKKEKSEGGEDVSLILFKLIFIPNPPH